MNIVQQAFSRAGNAAVDQASLSRGFGVIPLAAREKSPIWPRLFCHLPSLQQTSG